MAKAQSNVTQPAPLSIGEQFMQTDAVKELHELMEQRKKLEAAANDSPAQIQDAERELSILRAALASKEADAVMAEGKELAALDKEIEGIAHSITQKESEIRRSQARLSAVESRIESLDQKIEIAIDLVHREATITASNVRDRIAEEIREKIVALQISYSRIRTLHSFIPSDVSRDFLTVAHVPDPTACLVYRAKGANIDSSANLLAVQSKDTAAADAEMIAALRPVSQTLVLCRRFRPYTPHAKRPAPYVRKGAYDGPGGRVDRPEDSEPKEEPPKMKTIEEAMAEPYTIKGDANGIRTWKNLPPADLNVGQAMLQNTD